MKKSLAILALATMGASSFAVTLNFDDLVGQNAMADGYGGANWTAGSWWYYDWAQPPYNPTSGATRLYSVGSAEVSFNSDVFLTGAWFNGYGTPNGFLPIYFEMYNNNVLVATSGQIDLDGSGNAQFLASGYGGAIDAFVVKGSTGFYVMDDLTFDVVPEPATMTVMGLGLAAFVARRRKK